MNKSNNKQFPNQMTLTIKKNGNASSLEMRIDGTERAVTRVYDALYELFKNLEGEGQARFDRVEYGDVGESREEDAIGYLPD